jgi:hypothetical protein
VFSQVRCAGRVVVDVMRVMQMQDALRLYSLGEIAMATLGRTFEVRPSLCPPLSLARHLDSSEEGSELVSFPSLSLFP